MKILKINGRKGHNKNNVLHKIKVDPFTKTIEILGGDFHEKDLEKLSEWIDIYKENTDDRISLKFSKLLTAPDSDIWRYLDGANFPLFTNSWNDKVNDAYKPGHSALSKILSKFKEFNFEIEDDNVSHPGLEANFDRGTIKITGRIVSEVTMAYMFPLLTWIDNYIDITTQKIKIELKLEYFNTVASKVIMEIFMMIRNSLNKLEIEWYYTDDDEDMKEAGLEYQRICKLGAQLKLISYDIP